MFKVKMLCYDYGNPVPYVDEPAENPVFESRNEALLHARLLAEDEADYLNEECADAAMNDMENGICDTDPAGFGVCDDDARFKQGCIDVCLYSEGGQDTVTTYFVEEVA